MSQDAAPTDPTPADFAYFIDHETGLPLLSEATRRMLHAACELLYDELKGELEAEHHKGQPLPWVEASGTSWFEDAFPPAALPHIGWREIDHLFLAFLTVTHRLGEGPLGDGLCSNTYEEFAMRLILERAKAFAQEIPDHDDEYRRGLGFDVDEVFLDDVYEMAFEDFDHELLFIPAMDGIEDQEDTGQSMGLGMLQRQRWLEPFGTALHRTHPLLWNWSRQPG